MPSQRLIGFHSSSPRPRSPGRTRGILLALTGLLACGTPTLRAASVDPAPLPVGMGVDVDLSRAADLLAELPTLPEGDVPPSFVLRVGLRWTDLEIAPGSFDGSTLAAVLEQAAARRVPLVLALGGPAPSDVGFIEEGPDLDRWVAFVAWVAGVSAGRARGYSLWDGANEAEAWGGAPSVRVLAFLIKRSSIAIKGADAGAVVAQGALRASVSFQADLLEEGIAPFVDAYGVDVAGVEDPAGALEAVAAALRAKDPGAPLWVHRAELPEPSPGDPTPWAVRAWSSAVEARGGAAGLVTFAVPPPGEGRPRLADVVSAHVRALPSDAVVALTLGDEAVSFPAEAEVRSVRHVVAGDLSTRMAFWTPGAKPGRPGTVEASIDTSDAGNFRLIDPLGDFEGPLEGINAQPRAGVYRVVLPRTPRPLVLAYDRVQREDAVEEALEVSGRASLSADEILARHLQAQAAWDRRLRHYTADLTTEMRYQLGQSGQGIEVRIDGRYYHDAAGAREIENLEFFINGAPYEPKRRIPEIPLLEPDKVTVLPLDVHLDRTYAYELDGEEEVLGRRAYRLQFRPLAAKEGRYAGTVWIDAATFDRLRVRLVQTDLEPPVNSNEQVDTYGRVTGADGLDHWLVTGSDIQRVVSVLGTSVVVRMRLAFSGHVVNGGDFESQVEAAHASDHQVLRDTEKGFQYLEKLEDGTRVVSPGSSRKVLIVAGARVDPSYDGVLPLAGLNWLDNDFLHRGLQLNVFAAGAINTMILADPGLFGTNVEGSIEAFVPFVALGDRLRLPGAEVDDSQEVKVRAPSIAVGIGVPVGRAGKMALEAEIEHQSWKRADDTDPAFVEPGDGLVSTLAVRAEIHRFGWDFSGHVAQAWRSNWDLWGPDGGVDAPAFFESGDRSYTRWGARASRTWFVKEIQAVSFEADLLGGSSLDRFSQYEFSGFGGPRLAGFAGSGIHFDEALLLHFGYGVDVAKLFGLQIGLDAGRVRNDSLPEAFASEFGEWSQQVGVGLSGTVPGPWGTLVTFDVGYALDSDDYQDVEGDVVGQVVFLKLLR